LCFAGLLLAGSATAGTTSTVQIVDFLFSPSNSVVSAGDSITWRNASSFNPHDSTQTSTPHLWASARLSPNATFTFTFTNAGGFHYFCATHATPGALLFHPEQNGNVTVLAGNTGPTVSLTNPPANKHFFAPASITLQASASANVTNVQFFADTTLLGSSSTSPYQFVANNLLQGTYKLTAQAIDNAGARGTSAVVTAFVDAPPTVQLQNPQMLAVNKFQFRISGGAAGQQCDIQASSTLSGWSSIAITNFPNTTCPLCPFIDFTDPNAPPDRRFYKVIISP
jgi:plastocyanin